jgi:hypothetical protein
MRLVRIAIDETVKANNKSIFFPMNPIKYSNSQFYEVQFFDFCHWLLVIGYWSLVIGHWLLVIGYSHWLLVDML